MRRGARGDGLRGLRVDGRRGRLGQPDGRGARRRAGAAERFVFVVLMFLLCVWSFVATRTTTSCGLWLTTDHLSAAWMALYLRCPHD